MSEKYVSVGRQVFKIAEVGDDEFVMEAPTDQLAHEIAYRLTVKAYKAENPGKLKEPPK